MLAWRLVHTAPATTAPRFTSRLVVSSSRGNLSLPLSLSLFDVDSVCAACATSLSPSHTHTNTHTRTHTPFVFISNVAAADGKLAAARRLIDLGARLESTIFVVQTKKEEHTLFRATHVAAFNGHLGVVEMLLDAGASVDSRDGEGCTALHIAVKRRRFRIVCLLAARGAALDAVNKAGQVRFPFDCRVVTVCRAG